MDFNVQDIDLVELIYRPNWKNILFDIVKSNKMDPWDIDVAILAEKYLDRINSMEDVNLRIPANAILTSAILLRFKSRSLKITSIKEEDDFLEEQGLIDGAINSKDFIQTMDDIPDLRPLRQARQGKVTLDELVFAIEKVIVKTKKSVPITRTPPKFDIPLPEFDFKKAEKEIMDEMKLKADTEGMITFSELVQGKTRIELIQAFIVLLMLSTEGELSLLQEEFFGEIIITILNN